MSIVSIPKTKEILKIRIKVDIKKIEKSIALIKNSNIDYEFRTTAVPTLVNEKEILKIARWLSPAKRYCIQQFRNTAGLVDKKMTQVKPFDSDKLKLFAEIAKPYFDEVVVR